MRDIEALGYEVMTTNHAAAIITHDFAQVLRELVSVMEAFTLPVEELVSSGGGEAASTQWLRRELSQMGWRKHNFQLTSTIDGVARQSISHEIDHVRKAARGSVALEIEWNNKDPFFDRDLENFQRLHALSVISFGVVLTRGASLQSAMVDLVTRCLTKHGIADEAGLAAFDMKERTARQRRLVERAMEGGDSFAAAFARTFVADKFGPATTHWTKLSDRVARGVGNPCPLLLIGIPASRVVV